MDFLFSQVFDDHHPSFSIFEEKIPEYDVERKYNMNKRIKNMQFNCIIFNS